MVPEPDSLLTRPVRTYDDAQRLLLSRVRDDPRPYAERGAIAGHAVSALLERVGRPQDRLRFVHLAGSKGKGSVALMAEHLLLSADEPTATFTSPHLRRWNERIRINGAAISDEELCMVLDALRPHLMELDAGSDDLAPSFFDLVTAAGFVAFERAGCAMVVLETGLGGLYDATNIVTPVVSGITSIELEHTDKLGGTLEGIARHKAGIIKPGIPIVTGDLPPQASNVIQQQALEVNARELRYGRDWHVESLPGRPGTQQVRYRQSAPLAAYDAAFTCPHPAPHMAVNAGVALTLVRAAGFDPDPTCLESCALPARVQVLNREPWIVVDGAHTSSSLEALGESLVGFPAIHRRFLISATRGKSLEALATLLRDADAVLVTRADDVRSAPAKDVARELKGLLPDVTITAQEDPARALESIRRDLPPDALLCICGSVYLAGFALSVLTPQSADITQNASD